MSLWRYASSRFKKNGDHASNMGMTVHWKRPASATPPNAVTIGCDPLITKMAPAPTSSTMLVTCDFRREYHRPRRPKRMVGHWTRKP